MDCVVADAVVVEPVSTPHFPDNREKNREFCKFRASGAAMTANNAVISVLSMRIPYSAKQGIILAKQRIVFAEQGILPSKIEITAG